MYILETLEDKLKYELGARDLEIMILSDKLEKANRQIDEMNNKNKSSENSEDL